MFRKTMVIFSMAAAALLLAIQPALAAAPAFGTVFEGQGVPGLSLGDTRAQAEASFDAPQWCQSVSAGDMAFCSFPVEGGGQVDVRYRGSDGGNASNSPDDVAYHISWSEPVTGWTTSAGVYTALAAADPGAVMSAYPNAQVTYNIFGNIYSVIDSQLGIQVYWIPNFYTGQVHVSMGISYPSTPPPPQEQLVRVVDINLGIIKGRGKPGISALVSVRDEQGLAAPGTSVIAHWVYPDGGTKEIEATTSSSGYAYFELRKAPHGTYTLVIDDVVLDGHTFDVENSVLSASIQVW